MDKLDLLREQLGKKKLDGFIVPMSDEFQSEYAPEYARRLEWLTGFSGSAGTAIILRQKAAFFTDGRYTLQARDQVDSDLYEIYNISDKSPYQWLKKNVESDEVIGFDPWLHTQDNVSYYQKAVDEGGFFLLPTDNLIDKIWEDKPEPPSEKIFLHDIQYAGLSYWEKRENIIGKMEEKEIDAMIIGTPESVCWLFNIRGKDLANSPIALCYAILYVTGIARLYIDKKKVDKRTALDMGSEIRAHSVEDISESIEELRGKRVQIDPSTSAAMLFNFLKENDVEFVEDEDPCLLLKACKNDVEIAGAKEAHKRDGAAICKFLCWLEEAIKNKDITEISAAEKLLEFRKENERFYSPSFDTISGYGSNGAIVHYRADEESNKKLEEGSLYLVDSGAQYLDGTTDITRTIAIGTPTKEQREHFTYVLKGHIALAQAKFPDGTTGAQIDSLARAPLWQNGMDYDHGTGHGVGSFLNVHEGPQRISKNSRGAALKAGMIVSNEPGFYLEGEYGIRIENLITVIESRGLGGQKKVFYEFENLTLAPIDLSLVKKSIMTEDEINWLNFYHAKVIKELSPLLDSDTREWLKEKTRQI